MTSLRLCVAPTCLLLSAAAASAGLSQSQVTPPGGFLQTGAYFSTSGGSMTTGGDLSAIFGTGEEFHEQLFAGNGTASLSAQASSATISNSVSATVGQGFFRVSAQNEFPPSAFFNAAMANGGWKETFTVSHPTLNGQPGYMIFLIRARGSM